MASVTHQALLMVGTGVVATVPNGWHQQLSGVAPSVARDRYGPMKAAAYRNGWLSPPAVIVTVVNFGWSQQLSVAPIAANAIRADDGSYQGNWKAGLDPSFSAVVLLMGYEGADASTGAPGMTDETGRHGLATVNGNAQIDTAQQKFGTASLLLDGTGDFLQFADSDDWDLSNANSDTFTIECSVRFNATGANKIFIAQYFTVGTFGWGFQTGSSAAEFKFGSSSDGSTFNVDVQTVGAALTTGVWYQLACDKDATGKIRVYKNGVMLASSTPADSSIKNVPITLAIGASSGGSGTLNGWLDEVRITKGVARYASDSGYTPATARFPRS